VPIPANPARDANNFLRDDLLSIFFIVGSFYRMN